MKKYVLILAAVSFLAFEVPAYAAPCGDIDTSAFNSAITAVSSSSFGGGGKSGKKKKNAAVKSIKSSISSGCSMMESMDNGSLNPSISTALGGLNTNFTSQLSSITNLLSQVKSLQSNPTAAGQAQALALINQAVSLANQIKSMVTQAKKQLQSSLEVNL